MFLKLLQLLYKNKSEYEIAKKCYELSVIPAVKNDILAECDNKPFYMKLLTKTILLFDDYDNILEQLYKSANLESDILTILINEFSMSFDKYKKSKTILNLFQTHMEWLEKQIEVIDEPDWRMDVSVPGHPIVEAFLKSNEQSMNYRGAFLGIQDARNFILKLYACGESLACNASGSGRKVVVNITKINTAYKLVINKMKQYKEQLIYLRKLIPTKNTENQLINHNANLKEPMKEMNQQRSHSTSSVIMLNSDNKSKENSKRKSHFEFNVSKQKENINENAKTGTDMNIDNIDFY